MNIVVCTIPRSGSMWFKDELRSRGYPECNEWAHPTNKGFNKNYWIKIKAAKRYKRNFGIKLFPHHARTKGGMEKVLAEIDNPPNVFIRLKRNDIEGQSKSYANMKIVKGSWERSSQHLGRANEQEIEECREFMIESNEFWDEYLKDKEHIVVYYEDMVADTEKEMDRVIEYIESKRVDNE